VYKLMSLDDPEDAPQEMGFFDTLRAKIPFMSS
jgi:hypothetical protein